MLELVPRGTKKRTWIMRSTIRYVHYWRPSPDQFCCEVFRCSSRDADREKDL
jgi:hypothetical protein